MEIVARRHRRFVDVENVLACDDLVNAPRREASASDRRGYRSCVRAQIAADENRRSGDSDDPFAVTNLRAFLEDREVCRLSECEDHSVATDLEAGIGSIVLDRLPSSARVGIA